MTDITLPQLLRHHIVARRLWPYSARRAAWRHNKERHNGVPTAHIDPDWTPDSEHPQFEGVTWSVDRVNESDVLYLRAPDPAELRATLPPSDDDDCECHYAVPYGWVIAADCPFHGS